MAEASTSEPTGAEHQENPHHARRWWILTVIGVAQLMIFLDTTVVSIALPSAQEDLGFTDSTRQWIVTAYALAFGSLLLLGGRLADLFGHKRALLVGLVGFAVVSLLGGVAVNFGMLVSARALQGVFAAIVAPAALSFLLTTFSDPGERTKAFGIYGALGSSGIAIGLLLGGALTGSLNWRWCMFVNIVFAAAVFAGAMLLLHNRPATTRPRLDFPGTLAASAGLFAVTYGLSNAAEGSWSDVSVWGPLVAGVLLLIAFVVVETRTAQPLLPLRILLDRNRGGSYLAMFLLGVGLLGVFLFLTYYLQRSLAFSPIQAGLAFLPMVVTLAIGGTVLPAVLYPRFSARAVLTGAMIVAAAGIFWLSRIDTASTYASGVLFPLMIAGFGMGMVVALGTAVATVGVAPEDSGAASALVNTVQQVGGSIGTALLSTLAVTAGASFVAGKAPTPTLAAEAAVHSYTVAFTWAAVVFLAGAVLCGLLLVRPATVVPEADLAPTATT
jgi:EmrB/QacA subfamily drug resistance transporter